MKATVALFFLGLCSAVPLHERQGPDDPNATFTTTPQLKIRQAPGTQPPPFPTNTGPPGFGPGLGPVEGLTGRQQPGNDDQGSDQQSGQLPEAVPRNLRLPPFGGPPPPVPPFMGGHGPPVPVGGPPPPPVYDGLRPDGASPACATRGHGVIEPQIKNNVFHSLSND
ncbi:hypothetical protein F4803DRAFT_546800 [Xylaria telfairii]|nr:hypothetical protein F4803DRAFT_546800 [Xylaria telfairii]